MHMYFFNTAGNLINNENGFFNLVKCTKNGMQLHIDFALIVVQSPNQGYKPFKT